MMDELRAYLYGWLTVRVGPLEPFFSWLGAKSGDPGADPERLLPHFALGAAHGLGSSPRSLVPLLSAVAVTDELEQLGTAQRDACMPFNRPSGPRCDVVREGRSVVGKLMPNGHALFPRARGLMDRLIDWIASDAQHCRG